MFHKLGYPNRFIDLPCPFRKLISTKAKIDRVVLSNLLSYATNDLQRKSHSFLKGPSVFINPVVRVCIHELCNEISMSPMDFHTVKTSPFSSIRSIRKFFHKRLDLRDGQFSWLNF